MKRIYNYILISALVFIAVGCINEGLEPDTPSAGNGNDVQFGLSFDELETRTIYGSETSTGFPIYWSQGDKVLVGSPQCAVTSAEYEVTPVSGQSYAEAMNKTSAAGIQWGSTDADFYSVYPSTNASWTNLTEDNVTAKLNISSEQSANYVLSDNVYIAADMQNVIMYAQTNDVVNGSTANLKYKPYSTILEFELNIGKIVDDQGNETNNYGSAKIMSLTLNAPEGTAITGDFSLKFNGSDDPTISATGNNGNSIKMDFTTQPMLDETNKTLKVKLAMIPISGVKINGWTFTVEYIDGNSTVATTKTKTLNVDKELKPGMIHKLKMPIFPTQEAAWDPEMGEWITTLYDYKNIYITELSLPGAWYAGAPTGDGYQATNSFATLWSEGVRAFAVECRSAIPSISFSDTSPNRVVISGTGSNSTGLIGGKYYYSGTRISTVIKSIADQVASAVTKDASGTIIDGEFAVLVLSYADGGEGGHRDQDHAYFINGIKSEIDEAGVSNIYTGPVTANTTVYDVLGKLIIKVNVDDNLTQSSYAGDMNALLSYNPFMQQLPADTIVNEDGTETSAVDYTKIRFSKMYWKTWADTYKTFATSNPSDFLWCFSSANRTQANTGTNTTIPTYAQRQTALRGMMENSKELTETKKHNVWFYFNAGGTQTTSMTDDETSATDFATTMNAWLYELVKLKANGGTDTNGVYGTAGAYVESDPSPLGIVMFNQCTSDTYYGPAIIEEIVHMNNKFKLLRAADTDNSEEEEEEGDEL